MHGSKQQGLRKKFTSVASMVVLFALLAAAICTSATDNPTATVKGYVLDSACAFTRVSASPLASSVRRRVQMQGHNSSFSRTTELFTGRSPIPRHRVGRTRNFCRLLETR